MNANEVSQSDAKKDESTDEQFLYVLEQRPGTLRNSANYLKNRGWKIQSTTRVKDFLALVMGSQPPLVMICIDHSNPTVGNLSKLINSAFPNTKVIAFVDGTTSASLTKLKNSKHEYTVYPPLSGPAIERVILRVQKDQQRALEEPATVDSTGPAHEGDKSGGDAVVIKGRGLGAGPSSGSSSGSAAEQARTMLAQFMATSDAGDQNDANAAAEDAADDSMTGLMTGFPGGAAAKTTTSARASGPLRSSAMMGGRRMLSRRQRSPDHASAQSPALPKMDFSHEGGWKLRELDETGTASSRRSKGLPRFTQAEASLIIEATDAALDGTVIKGKTTPRTERLSATTSVACIAIDSEKFMGYLVAALGKNRKMDETFIKEIRRRLVEFMKAAGEEFSADDTHDLNLQEVEFEDWALKQAEFLRKTIHDGQEIAMAFFPEKINSAPLEISASKNMLKLDINELVGNATMEFDLYVHLPTNNKYVLYTRQDQTLYSDQLDRLKTKGVQSMHLRKEDETQVRRYRVRNFLNDKIKEHLDEADAKAG